MNMYSMISPEATTTAAPSVPTVRWWSYSWESHRNLRFFSFHYNISRFSHSFIQIHLWFYIIYRKVILYTQICIIIKIYIDVCVCTWKLQQKRSKSSWKAPLHSRLMDLMAKRIPQKQFIVFSALPTIYYKSGLICCVFMIPACTSVRPPSVSQSVSQSAIYSISIILLTISA